MALVLAVTVSVPMRYVHAQEAADGKTATAAATQVFSTDQQAEAREALKALGEALGVNDEKVPPAKDAKAAGKEEKGKKTMADVADKALDAVTNAVGSIAGKMEQVAPKVWEVMVIQQYAKAVGNLITPWSIVLLTILAALIARKSWKLTEAEAVGDIFNDDFLTRRGWRAFVTFFIPFCIVVIFFAVGVYRLSDSVMYVINPDYYAVKDLLRMLLKPGSV